MNIVKLSLPLLLSVALCSVVYADNFKISHNGHSVPLVFDLGDAEVVRVVAKALSNDIALVSGTKAPLLHAVPKDQKTAILIGTLGKSMLISQFLDVAWDIDAWTRTNAHTYPEYWFRQQFGDVAAKQIAPIMRDYYRLAQAGRVGRINGIPMSDYRIQQRLAAYKQLAERAERIKRKMDPAWADAYFQLVYYPVMASFHYNVGILKIKKMIKEGDLKAKTRLRTAIDESFSEIEQLTKFYNEEMSNGKWNKTMMAKTSVTGPLFPGKKFFGKSHTKYLKVPDEEPNQKPVAICQANSSTLLHSVAKRQLLFVPELGIGGGAVITADTTPTEMENVMQAPYVEFEFSVSEDMKADIYAKFLPSHVSHPDQRLVYGISVNGRPPTLVQVGNHLHKNWWGWGAAQNRGYYIGISKTSIKKEKSKFVPTCYPQISV